MNYIKNFSDFHEQNEGLKSIKPWLVGGALALATPSKSQYDLLYQRRYSAPDVGGTSLPLSSGGPVGPSARKIAKYQKAAEKQDKRDLEEAQNKLKNFLSLDYDRDSYQLEKDEKMAYHQEFQKFMAENPNELKESDGFTTEQKYAMVSKILDFIKKVPQISYSSRLRNRFGLNDKSSILDVIEVVDKMGGWKKFFEWIASGGPEIKTTSGSSWSYN